MYGYKVLTIVNKTEQDIENELNKWGEIGWSISHVNGTLIYMARSVVSESEKEFPRRSRSRPGTRDSSGTAPSGKPRPRGAARAAWR